MSSTRTRPPTQNVERAEQPHNATIRVGPRVFDLLVSPLMDHHKRIGFAVEWADAKDRLLNLDYAARNSAIDRSQAVIEFRPTVSCWTPTRIS